jgi:hypothetical protein
VCALLLTGQASAHHSFAAFDTTQKLVLAGTVRELQWGNPHVWLQVLVPNKAGVVEEWGFESFGISMLRRAGWKSTSLKPGDKVTVTVSPMKDGSRGGQLLRVILADGTVLKGYER